MTVITQQIARQVINDTKYVLPTLAAYFHKHGQEKRAMAAMVVSLLIKPLPSMLQSAMTMFAISYLSIIDGEQDGAQDAQNAITKFEMDTAGYGGDGGYGVMSNIAYRDVDNRVESTVDRVKTLLRDVYPMAGFGMYATIPASEIVEDGVARKTVRHSVRNLVSFVPARLTMPMAWMLVSQYMSDESSSHDAFHAAAFVSLLKTGVFPMFAKKKEDGALIERIISVCAWGTGMIDDDESEPEDKLLEIAEYDTDMADDIIDWWQYVCAVASGAEQDDRELEQFTDDMIDFHVGMSHIAQIARDVRDIASKLGIADDDVDKEQSDEGDFDPDSDEWVLE